MNKDEIRDIIFSKKANRELLTPGEKEIALNYFTEEEMKCMVMPTFNHESCFSEKSISFITSSKLQAVKLSDK